jgi:hypothetical protein
MLPSPNPRSSLGASAHTQTRRHPQPYTHSVNPPSNTHTHIHRLMYTEKTQTKQTSADTHAFTRLLGILGPSCPRQAPWDPHTPRTACSSLGQPNQRASARQASTILGRPWRLARRDRIRCRWVSGRREGEVPVQLLQCRSLGVTGERKGASGNPGAWSPAACRVSQDKLEGPCCGGGGLGPCGDKDTGRSPGLRATAGLWRQSRSGGDGPQFPSLCKLQYWVARTRCPGQKLGIK